MVTHLLGAMLLASAPAPAPAPAPRSAAPALAAVSDAQLKAAVDRIAAEALAAGEAAGFAVAVVEDGRVRLARGYGFADLEQRTPVSADTVFRIGSVTKEFTAAGVLLLAERGRLSLDDRLAKFVPDFPRAGEVTIRQLLNHTSGIRNYTSVPDFLPAVSPRDYTTADFIKVIGAVDPLYDFAPGTSWSYSNSGYFLLGAVIERVSGQRYADFLQTNMFRPLGLLHTKPDDLGEIVSGRAEGYDKDPARPGAFRNAGHLSMSVAAAAGAMRSTAGDLARWHEALLGGRVLKPESLALMTTPGRLADGRLASLARPAAQTIPGVVSDYGLGIATSVRDGRRGIGHGGSINGFNAALQTYPEIRTTVVLLTNTGGGTAKLMPRLVETVFASRWPAASE
uniref:serine hydrolase domain-containing protein n=1 Tax=uncultured Sphingomonas sp. TaxID=158754 RepID=UPI0025E48E56|nr:serine hydrolase domain-containing protein [uncultured Sphingomonas sp.]